jgi:uncharacterized cupredoxin-like copper-binding protein
LVPLIALLGVALSGCAGETPPRATIVRVVERDFRISAPKQVHHGDLILAVTNKGPGDHELIIIRRQNTPLPLRSDGLTVDEDALLATKQGALEPGEPHTMRQLRLHLRPGRYVLICNMSGHLMAGMREDLVVR